MLLIGAVGAIAGLLMWRKAQTGLVRGLGLGLAIVSLALPLLLILSLSNIAVPF